MNIKLIRDYISSCPRILHIIVLSSKMQSPLLSYTVQDFNEKHIWEKNTCIVISQNTGFRVLFYDMMDQLFTYKFAYAPPIWNDAAISGWTNEIIVTFQNLLCHFTASHPQPVTFLCEVGCKTNTYLLILLLCIYEFMGDFHKARQELTAHFNCIEPVWPIYYMSHIFPAFIAAFSWTFSDDEEEDEGMEDTSNDEKNLIIDFENETY